MTPTATETRIAEPAETATGTATEAPTEAPTGEPTATEVATSTATATRTPKATATVEPDETLTPTVTPTVAVDTPALPPGVISSEPVTAVFTGETYRYLVEFEPGAEASGAEVDLTLGGASVPTWLGLEPVDERSAELTGTPTREDVGEHPVELVLLVNDTPQFTQTFTVTVSLPPNPIQTADVLVETEEDVATAARITATHATDDPLVYALASSPQAGVVTDLDPFSGEFEYLPLPDYAGEDGFAVEIADSQGVTTTALVTVTILPVDDAPQMPPLPELTLAEGDAVEVPLAIVEPDGQAYTVTVAGLPAGLEIISDTITGTVAGDAAALSPYSVEIGVEDEVGNFTPSTATWIVEPAAEESHLDEPVPTEEAPPDEASTSSDETPSGEELSLPDSTPSEEEPAADEEPAGGDESTGNEAPDAEEPPPATEVGPVTSSVLTVPVTLAAEYLPGSGTLAGYVWQTPADFGTCPSVADALSPQPGLEGSSSFAEATATDRVEAPALTFDLDVAAADDYVVFVCGCAPAYPGEDGESSPENNDAVLVAVAPVAGESDAMPPVLVEGFAAVAGFNWQTGAAGAAEDASVAPGIVTIPEVGAHRLRLEMVEDGVIVHQIALVPLAQADQMGAGAPCAAPTEP